MDAIIIVFAVVALVLSLFMHRALLYAIVLGFVHCAASVAVGRVESAIIGGILVLTVIGVPAIVIISWKGGETR